MSTMRFLRSAACAGLVMAMWAGCRPSDVLSVPPPAGVTVAGAYNNQSGAEALFQDGKGALFLADAEGFNGLIQWAGLLSDEYSLAAFVYLSTSANVDARRTLGGGGYSEPTDQTLQSIMGARVALLTALPGLKKFEPAGGQSMIGEAYALIGYAELLGAEDYCPGIALGQLSSTSGPQYGVPLSTDSLLQAAETDFDSALAYTGGSDTVQMLASVGLARALLNRGQFAAAATAVQSVPTGFVYNSVLEPGGFFSAQAPYSFNEYDTETQDFQCGLINVTDHKGGNGLNYASANDPRLVVSTTVGETCDGVAFVPLPDSVWYYPMKFGLESTTIPMASGIEARLIEAEAALQASDVATWAADLNALRADTADTHVGGLPPLASDSTTGASPSLQVDVMFRERAFWLYGTGTRLGDMRRLVRQYGRDQSTVYPVGAYPGAGNAALPSPLATYGTDVDFTLPTNAGGLADPNPAYKGCLSPTSKA